MPLNIDLNYPPPGQDLFSLEDKYGINFLRLIGDVDYSGPSNQQVQNDRVVSIDDIPRLVGPSGKRTRLTAIKRIARSRNSNNEFEYLPIDKVSKEAKEPNAPAFYCSICLGTMHEETSTKCGHIFCNSCLFSAIKTQGKCPTCRRKLKRTDAFRVYLPDLK